MCKTRLRPQSDVTEFNHTQAWLFTIPPLDGRKSTIDW